MNVIARLEYELAYYDSAVHRFNHYTTRTPASEGEALVQKLWIIWSTPSMPLLQGPLWPGVVVPIRVSYLGQIELFCHLLRLIIIIIVSCEFFTPALADGLSIESERGKFLPVSRTQLSILADLSNTIVWMVSAGPPISNSSSPITNPLETGPWGPITASITVTLMFHSFFSALWQGHRTCLFFRGPPGQQSSLFRRFSFIFVNYH